MRTHPTRNGRHRTWSAATPTVFTSPADAPPTDRRSLTPGYGQQGNVVCPECGAEVATRLVTHSNPSRYGDVPPDKGTRVLGQHRSGGGRYSARRGDNLCPSSGTQPEGDTS